MTPEEKQAFDRLKAEVDTLKAEKAEAEKKAERSRSGCQEKPSQGEIIRRRFQKKPKTASLKDCQTRP